MYTNNRQPLILDYIRKQKIIKVNELSEYFNVAEMTVRRDLMFLEKNGLIIRTHGGAMLSDYMKNAAGSESDFVSQQIQNFAEKRIIAEKAISLINDNMSIYIDGSTTCAEIAKIITQKKNLTVFSDSIAAVIELRKRLENITIVLTGGELAGDNNTLDGYIAIEMAQKICVDIGFISCGGFSEDGITNAGFIGIQVKNNILNNAKTRVLVADSSKYNKRCIYMLSGWDKINYLISDKGLNEDDAKKIETQGPAVILA